MGFASTYLDNRALFPAFIKEAPEKNTGIIVVIPAYNEPGICKVLDSLIICSPPDCRVEIIIAINAPANASDESLINNRISFENIEKWKIENKSCFFRLFAFIVDSPDIKNWGVGLARKCGMDEAIRRFDFIDKVDGVILNLDADCLVDENYFISVFCELALRKEKTACSIYFEHPLTGSEFPENIYRYIILYELHLRYYYQGLAFSGFPYVFHTVGSAIAVKAGSYVKVGGMNRRQAGEDFYFIQKLIPVGGYFNLHSTTIFPSPRSSSRVPFGTGASIGKLDSGNESTLYTYNANAFAELRTLFSMIELIYKNAEDQLYNIFSTLPEGLQLFLGKEEWAEKLVEIKNNTSGYLSFRKRFFDWFNMFKIVKYLNAVHLKQFKKKPIDISALELLDKKGILFQSGEVSDLLHFFRAMEKNY